MDKPKYRAYLCCGPNCGPKGASALVDFLSEVVERSGLEAEVSVDATGCQAHCESGPTMVVYPGPVYYQGMDEGRLERIVREHFIGGAPVRDFFWTGVRRRILPDGRVITPKYIIEPESDEAAGMDAGRSQERKPRPKPRVPDVDDFKW